MRMTLTNKADYAVRAVLDIARHYPGLRTRRQITVAMDLPGNFLSQILATLVRHGVLDSTAGPAGGYTLAQTPAETTLLDVIELIEGPIALDECVLGGGACDWTQSCPFHEAWSEAKTAFTSRLAATNFDDLTHIDQAIRAGTYQPPAHTPPHPTTPARHGTND